MCDICNQCNLLKTISKKNNRTINKSTNISIEN